MLLLSVASIKKAQCISYRLFFTSHLIGRNFARICSLTHTLINITTLQNCATQREPSNTSSGVLLKQLFRRLLIDSCLFRLTDPRQQNFEDSVVWLAMDFASWSLSICLLFCVSSCTATLLAHVLSRI